MPNTWPNAGHFNQTIENKTTGIPITGSYTVYKADGITQATIYSNRARSSTVAQPLTTDTNGDCNFYTDPQEVQISISGSTVITDVLPWATDLLNPPAGTTVFVSTTSPAATASDTGDVWIDYSNKAYALFGGGSWGTSRKFDANNFVSAAGATTTYTLQASDDGKILGFGAGTANNITITVPASWPMNNSTDIVNEGAGTITFISDGTSVLHANGVASTTTIHHPGQYGGVTVLCRYNPGSAADCLIFNGTA